MSSYQKTDEVLDALRRRVDEQPLDWDLRLIYADRLAELGLEELEIAQRWLAREHRRPGGILMDGYDRITYWVWGPETRQPPEAGMVRDIIYPHALLPARIFEEVKPYPGDSLKVSDMAQRAWRYYNTPWKAEWCLGHTLLHSLELRELRVVLRGGVP